MQISVEESMHTGISYEQKKCPIAIWVSEYSGFIDEISG